MTHFGIDGTQYQQVESGPGRACPGYYTFSRKHGQHYYTFHGCFLNKLVSQNAPSQLPTAGTAVPEASPTPEVDFEFSDVPTLMCLLCARQFKSLEQLKRHNKGSDLHKVCGSLV